MAFLGSAFCNISLSFSFRFVYILVVGRGLFRANRVSFCLASARKQAQGLRFDLANELNMVRRPCGNEILHSPWWDAGASFLSRAGVLTEHFCSACFYASARRLRKPANMAGDHVRTWYCLGCGGMD